MIILKYGNAKKLESAKRWKCKCSECGCKVILDKEDTERFRQEIDYDGCPYTEFTWVCPFCHETQSYNEYDSNIDKIKETLGDWIESILDFVCYHERLCDVIIALLVSGLLILTAGITSDLVDKHRDNTYNYRIEYEEADGDHCTDWTNDIEENGQYIVYVDENNHGKKVYINATVVTNLKEEE